MRPSAHSTLLVVAFWSHPVSFTPRQADDLQCHECGVPIALDEYRRFGLCPACEVDRDAGRLPDTVPEWMGRNPAPKGDAE